MKKDQIYQLNGKHYKVRDFGKDADGSFVKASLYHPETGKCQKGRPNKFAAGEFEKATLIKDVTETTTPKVTTPAPATVPVTEGEETLENIIESEDSAANTESPAEPTESEEEKAAWREKVLTNLGFDPNASNNDW